MTAYPRSGAPEPITHVLVDDEGAPVSGASVTVRVRRSDGLWLDWADGTYRARGAVAQLDETMPELDEPGAYEASWPGGAAGRYTAFVVVDGVVRGVLELHVGGLAAPGDEMALTPEAVTEAQAGLATAAALAEVASDASLSRKYLANRRRVSAVESTDTIYDDDGTTPLAVHELSDGLGNPITTPAGSPAQRSAPT